MKEEQTKRGYIVTAINELLMATIEVKYPNAEGSYSKGDFRIAGGHPVVQALEAELEAYANQRVGEALDKFEWRIDCNTAISELYGWKSIVAKSKEQTLRLIELNKARRAE